MCPRKAAKRKPAVNLDSILQRVIAFNEAAGGGAGQRRHAFLRYGRQMAGFASQWQGRRGTHGSLRSSSGVIGRSSRECGVLFETHA